MENKDNIERFFEKHLTRENFPYQEEDWKKMESMLDRELPVTPVAWWKRALPVAALGILAFLGGWYGHQWLVDIPESPNSPAGKVTSEAHALPEKELVESGKKLTRPVQPGETDQSTGNDLMSSGDMSGTDRSELRPADRTLERTETQKNEKATALTPGTYSTEKTGSNSQPDKQTAGEPHDTFRENLLPYLSPLEMTFQVGKLNNVVPEPFTRRHNATSTTEDPSAEKQSLEPDSRWSIGISIAPELNSVGIGKEQELAWEVGLSGMYSLTPHWRISTGALYARKEYVSTGEEYSPPKGYWKYYTNGKIPESVEANCSVLDIPINITYLWNPQSRLTFTTTGGVSSYFIFDENYAYSFHYNNPGAYDSWRVTDNSKAMLGMINLAVGLDYRLTGNLHLMVEPYFKIPVKQIGFGRIDLYGNGAFFTMRYSFNSKHVQNP